MNVRYRVELSQAEREELAAMLGGGKHAARKLKRAQILLAADRGGRDEEIARTVRVSLSTVGSAARQRFASPTSSSSASQASSRRRASPSSARRACRSTATPPAPA